jgi:hypothetical protein
MINGMMVEPNLPATEFKAKPIGLTEVGYDSAEKG